MSAVTGDTPQRARTRPGSRAHAIESAVRAEVQRVRRGVTAKEARAAYAAAEAVPSSFNAEFFSLVRRGILVATGGRASQTLYAPADATIVADEASAPADDATAVHQALIAATRRWRRWVTTREVTAELRVLGLKLEATQPNAVRTLLSTLARPRRRGHASWTAPRVLREAVPSATGAPTLRWCPAGADVPLPHDVPASESDAVRRLVATVEAELPGPASRQDLRWWLEAHPTHPIATVLDPKALGRVLDFTTQADTRAALHTAGRIRSLHGALRCHGGAPTRFMTSADPEWQAVAELEDALLGLRPDQEVEQIAMLRRRAERHASADLRAFADARLQALTDALRTHCGSDPCSRWGTLTQRIATRERWLEAARISSDARAARALPLRMLKSALAELERMLLGSRPDGAPQAAPPVVGLSATVSLTELEPFTVAAAGELGLAARGRHALLRAARRFPNPDANPQDRWQADTPFTHLNVVDRVDALASLCGAVQVPRMNALVRSAHELLGNIVRDPVPLLRIAERASGTDEVIWRAAVVALGLVGTRPRGDGLRVSDDPRNVRAWLLSAVLAKPHGLEETFWSEAAARWPGAQDLIDLAARRYMNGRLMTIIG